jgi:hypothetical protein
MTETRHLTSTALAMNLYTLIISKLSIPPASIIFTATASSGVKGNDVIPLNASILSSLFSAFRFFVRASQPYSYSRIVQWTFEKILFFVLYNSFSQEK